jgi:ribose transport system substrate-binding protein
VKRMNLLFFLLILFNSMIFGLGQSDADKSVYVFGASYMTMNNPFFIALNEGIKEVVEASGDKIIALDPALDQAKQIIQIQDLIDQGVDLIFLNPVDWKGIRPALEAARKAGIPIINIDSPVYDSNMVGSIVTSNNYNAGVLVAQDVLRKIGENAKVVLLEHPATKSGLDRTQSFVDTTKDIPGIEIIARENANGQLEQAMPVMKQIIRDHLEFDVVMGVNDPTAMGALAALQAEGREKDVLIYGVDGSPDTKKMVKEGKITATVAQSPMGLGRVAAEVAYKLLAGEDVEKEILVPVVLIDSSNVVSFGLDGWQ